MEINLLRAVRIALIGGALIVVGGLLEHWRHGAVCAAAKEKHGARVSEGAFNLGCELGYQHSRNGGSHETLLQSAQIYRQTGWFRAESTPVHGP